ncbi:MAG: class I SAM-dependent methyltransferase [Deltaproteobacteria bacterium]
MISGADHSQAALSASVETEKYSSMCVQFFLETLKQRSKVRLLDLGPVCEENIEFFARRIDKLFICDMFIRLDRARRHGQPCSLASRHLNYPSEMFDGILLWDLIDRLDREEARSLAQLCYRWLRPGGMVMLFAVGQQGMPLKVSSFVMTERFLVHLRVQHHLDLPVYGRQNRELLELLGPLTLAKSFMYRSGLREFILRRSDNL